MVCATIFCVGKKSGFLYAREIPETTDNNDEKIHV